LESSNSIHGYAGAGFVSGLLVLVLFAIATIVCVLIFS
jgi:hypothetical protein